MFAFVSPRKTLMVLLAAAVLAGCSANMSRDRGTPTQSSGDAALTRQVQEAILSTEQLRQADIRVWTTQGVVTLSGVADSNAIERKALEVARSVPGVRQVRSSLIVQGDRIGETSIAPTPPHQSLTNRGVQMHHSGETQGAMPDRQAQ